MASNSNFSRKRKFGDKNSHHGSKNSLHQSKRASKGNGVFVSKNGRQNLRAITRTGRGFDGKGAQEEFPNESEDLYDTQEPLEDSDSDEVQAESNSGKAYDALMVLLKNETAKDETSEPITGTQEADILDVDENEHLSDMDSDEEDSSEAEDAEDQSDDEQENDSKDAFQNHIVSPDSTNLDKLQDYTKSNSRFKWSTTDRCKIGNYSVIQQDIPKEIGINTKNSESLKAKLSPENLSSYNIKKRINNIIPNNKLSNPQSLIANGVFNYEDLIFPYHDYSMESEIRDLYCIHVVNHVLKTRDLILKNNMKLLKFKQKLENKSAPTNDSKDRASSEDENDEDLEEPELRDQSYTRAKVLILLPNRQSCYEVVEKIIKISDLHTVENKKKFQSQFYSNATVPEYKPEDFKYLFNGNSNDYFTLGMKFTRKSLKLYSSFGQSDIIFASPLGLKNILEKPSSSKNNQQQPIDFLSSIEVLIVDQANSIQYQNWDNLNFVLSKMNKIPESYNENLDFSRIKMWNINDQFKFIRQSLVFCKFTTPELNNLVNKSMNMQGKLKFKYVADTSDTKNGQRKTLIDQIVIPVKQSFVRFDCDNPINDPDFRFKYFQNSIVPFLIEQCDTKNDGILLFIPDYNDYLRVKNYLKFKTNLNFCAIDEYSDQKKLNRNRSLFESRKFQIMLYTERLHHYNRFDIKGVKNIVFYKLPVNIEFYKEIVSRFLSYSMMHNAITDINLSFVKVMFDKWDSIYLENLVGSKNVPVLCFGKKENYTFK